MESRETCTHSSLAKRLREHTLGSNAPTRVSQREIQLTKRHTYTHSSLTKRHTANKETYRETRREREARTGVTATAKSGCRRKDPRACSDTYEPTHARRHTETAVGEGT